jgi:hypothetical protein
LAQLYVKRGQHLPKAYGIKVRRYGEHVGEHIGNLMGTHWELKGKHSGNIVETHWEPGKNENYILLFGCMKFSLPKKVHHHVWPGLIPLQRTPYLLIEALVCTSVGHV